MSHSYNNESHEIIFHKQLKTKKHTETNKRHKSFIAFLNDSIGAAENVDPAEAITRMLDEQRALEASFQTFARMRRMSLVNFLK